MSKTKTRIGEVIKKDDVDKMLAANTPYIQTKSIEVIPPIDGELLPPVGDRFQEVNNLLDACERDIDNMSEHYGRLLWEVKRDELYKKEFNSFDEYLKARRNGMYRGTAERWINHCKVVECLTSEAQSRKVELAELPTQRVAQHLAAMRLPSYLLFGVWELLLRDNKTSEEDVKQFLKGEEKPKKKPTEKKESECAVIWAVDVSLQAKGQVFPDWEHTNGLTALRIKGDLPKIYAALRAMIDYCEQHNIRPVVSCK